MTMSYKFLLFPVLIILFFSCDDDDNIVGSGNLISEIRDASDFTDISVSESIRVDVSQGNEFRVELTADDNVIDRVESVIREGELRFSNGPRQLSQHDHQRAGYHAGHPANRNQHLLSRPYIRI